MEPSAPPDMPPDGETSRAQMRRVLRIESDALSQMAHELGPAHEAALDLLEAATGRVIVSGVGKSGHVGHKVAATFASTGTPALFVHATEASHGDLGMITPGDVCLVISNSGETTELADIVTYSRRFGNKLIAITRAPGSALARASDVVLPLPDAPEACVIGVAPTTSTTASLALGDALAVALMHRRGFRREDFQIFHPGGKLGAQLTPVASLMHRGAALPLVAPRTPMPQVVQVMSQKGFGIAGLVQEERLVGVITDGDLRRNINGLMGRAAEEIATGTPRTVAAQSLASEALKLMDDAKIGAVFVVDGAGRVQGLLRILDCLRAGVA